jgi:hypothetical protein
VSGGISHCSYASCCDYAVLVRNCILEQFQGKVVESCASLGMYQLHDGVQLCLAFLMKYTDIPIPCVGQSVSVYNAHWWKNEVDAKRDIVLCGRSCIVVQ